MTGQGRNSRGLKKRNFVEEGRRAHGEKDSVFSFSGAGVDIGDGRGGAQEFVARFSRNSNLDRLI
jgi:hypothetical protein